jgi:hypothetical protein
VLPCSNGSVIGLASALQFEEMKVSEGTLVAVLSISVHSFCT